MSSKELQSLPNGAKKPKVPPAPPTPPIGKHGVKIVTLGNGEEPFSGLGAKVIDLKTGNEVKNVREIHIHIVRDDIVYAEIVLFPSEVEIKGAQVKFTSPVTLIRSDVMRFLQYQAPPRVLRQFNRVFPEGLTETTSLADRWRRFKRRIHRQLKGDTAPFDMTRSDVVRWLYAQGLGGRALSEKFKRVFADWPEN